MFDVSSSFDFYQMLITDWDELNGDKQSARKVIHCIILANHLPEWIWHDWLKSDHVVKAKLGLTDRDSFIALLRTCVWLDILRAIVNGTKHFERQPFKTQLVKYQGLGDHGYLVIDLGEGAGIEHQFMPALHLIEVCVRFWRDFLKTHRPDVPLVHSTNHAI